MWHVVRLMGDAVLLSLGSNLADRAGQLRQALNAIALLPETQVTKVSRLYETAPLGELNQPAFLNVAAEIKTGLAPLELLNAAKGIERDLGRVDGPRWGPRLIDIDIILWGETVINEDALTIPHAQFRQRAFVLAPMCEIAPDARDPLTARTVRQLLDLLDTEGQVTPLNTDF